MTTDKLLPCPWCGSEARINASVGSHSRRFVVGCSGKQCPIFPYSSYTIEQEALEAWNARATTPLPDAEALVEKLEQIAKLGNEPYYGTSRGNTLAIECLEIIRQHTEQAAQWPRPQDEDDSPQAAKVPVASQSGAAIADKDQQWDDFFFGFKDGMWRPDDGAVAAFEKRYGRPPFNNVPKPGTDKKALQAAIDDVALYLQHDYAENEMPAGVYPMCELEHVDWEILVPRIIAAYKRAAT